MSYIVPAQTTIIPEESVVSLATYAAAIQYGECQFWGVRNEAAIENSQCRVIWTKGQRDDIAHYLAEAQREIEDEIGYFLQPRWVVGLVTDELFERDWLVDSQPLLSNPIITRWARVLGGGVRGTADISLGAAVDHTNDPAVIGPLATTVTETDEVFICHPGTDVFINPSAITISGGLLTITIPRCRMVKASLADNPTTGLDYDDVNNFEATVDIKRIYNDPSTNAVLVSPHTCSGSCLETGCSEHTQSACIYVNDYERGSIDVSPANYTGGQWLTSGASCCYPSIVRLNYRAGLTKLTTQMRDAVIRLAHSKMPDEPCGCETTQRLWRRDRNIPDRVNAARANNPFGLSDGAWMAWQFASSVAEVKFGII